ncbi:MAG: hypothetical protein J0L70_30315 [Leptolyngbya sp. UWPOB_LEPTO1]|uniref:hypothetical protein n=1 Tax=Leptolyngbya sp. UWPOB_LEPTO1 TaxID=2815653 RepID=UPI001ACDA58E|nr:hypothetical protein [Leptolyngbya sp. UWPOB_LEPTO1]MBN8564830.1 hypothetical protein [Leptolyngbya sp. UWPOB_LEPTO1]
MTTNSNNNDAIFTPLTEDEAATLNGGRYCYYVRLWRRVCYWYGCFFQSYTAIRCY